MGCGTGLVARYLTGRPQGLTGFELVGVDVSPGMLKVAEEEGFYRELRLRDATTLPASWAESFDMAIASSAVQFFPRPKVLFAEIQRVLKPGAKFLFSFDSGSPRPAGNLTSAGYYQFDCKSIQVALETEGFNVELSPPVFLRRERRRGPITGHLVVATKTLARA